MKKLYEKLALFKANLKQSQPKIQLPKIPEVKPIKPITIKKLAIKPAKIPAVSPDSKKDPKKIAQQIKDGSLSTKTIKILKSSQTKTLEIKSPEKGIQEDYDASYRFVDGKRDSFKHSSQAQIDLNDGINIASPKPIGAGAMGAHRAFNIRAGHGVILKNSKNHIDRDSRGHDKGFDSAQREVLYHDMAHKFFNLGKYVPTTAGFTKTITSGSFPARIENVNFSAMKEIPGAQSIKFNHDGNLISEVQENSLNKMYNSGDMHKLAIMDNIMANHDRHGANYLFDKEGDLHLIDHGTSFDYMNFDPIDTPHFYKMQRLNSVHPVFRDKVDNVSNDTLHPEAKRWLLNLNHDDAIKAFKDSGYSADADHVTNFMTRLANLQHLVKNHPNRDLTSLLKENRLSSGPMHPHHGGGPDIKVAN